jgi:hypothetical protein
MKKTILTLCAVVGSMGLSMAQMNGTNTAFTLIYQNATGTQNCLANVAPNNASVATNGGMFANVSGTAYAVASGVALTTITSGGTANGFNMFDFPLTTGTGPSAVCSSYRANSGTAGLDFSTQSNAKVRLYITASADNTPVQFWLGHSGGSYYPASSTYNVGNGSSAIQNLIVNTTTTYIDIDYTGSTFTSAWAAWAGSNDIDMWGLTYTGSTANITVTVQKILFGASLVTTTGTSSANVVNDQVSLYPNPAKGSFNIDMTAMANTESASVKVLNANGLLVKEFTTNNALEMISTDGLNRGIYMVQITSGNKIATKKVVVE